MAFLISLIKEKYSDFYDWLKPMLIIKAQAYRVRCLYPVTQKIGERDSTTYRKVELHLISENRTMYLTFEKSQFSQFIAMCVEQKAKMDGFNQNLVNTDFLKREQDQ